jgi:hypothetical protein
LNHHLAAANEAFAEYLAGESFVLPDRYQLRMLTGVWINGAETRSFLLQLSHNDPAPAQLKAFLIASE